MAGFWDSLGQGLQTAGGILSPQVSDQLAQERAAQTQQQNRLKELQATAIMNAVQSGSMDAQAGQQALGRLGLGNMAGLGPSPEAQNAQMIAKLNQQALGGGAPGLGVPTMGAPAAVPTQAPAMPPQAAPAAPGAPPAAPPAQPQPNGDGPAVTAYKQAMAQLQTPQGQAMLAAPATAPRVQAQLTQLRSAAELELQQKTAALAEKREAAAAASRDETPFIRETKAYDALVAAGKGDSAEAKALKKHIDKLDAPPRVSVNVNAGRQALDADTRQYMAQQYLTGDTSVLNGLARNPVEIGMMRQAIVKEARAQGMSPADISAKIAEFGGMKAGERTLGTRSANIEMAASEAASLAQLAKEASERVDRTGLKTLNQVEQAAQKATSNPDLRKFVASNTSLINAYARAINPQGVGTVADKEHAREMLDTAFSKGDYSATVDQLLKEIDAARKSPGTVKDSLRSGFTGSDGGKTDPLGIR